MPSGRENEIKLPSLDELFSSQQERDEAKLKHIYEIPIDQIDPFPDHPFKVTNTFLPKSAKNSGILDKDSPIILVERYFSAAKKRIIVAFLAFI